MALRYHLVRKKDMRKNAPQGAQLVYGQFRVSNRITFAYLCREIVNQTMATSGEVKHIVDSLLERLTAHLEMGNSVDLGELGGFRLSVGCQGSETVKGFSVDLFRQPRVLFTPGRALREMVRKATFDQLGEVKILKDEDEGDEPEGGL